MTSVLKGSLWEKMYTSFGVQDDIQLCSWMTNIGLAYTVVVGAYSSFFPAPYGRYSTSSTGPTINAKLAWMIQESPAFILPVCLIFTTPSSLLSNIPNAVALGLFMLHYFHRSFIFPFALAEDSKPTPVVTMLSAVVFCAYNGFLQGNHLLNVMQVESSPFLYIGVPLFLLGMTINTSHDRMLISLRKNASRTEDGRTEYKIPRGYLFEYISGANYFGEIIEWWALALITRGYPQIVFAIFSSTFLGLRACHHHSFYKRTFGETYPGSRKAIIPFIL